MRVHSVLLGTYSPRHFLVWLVNIGSPILQMPGIELPSWSTALFWAVEFGSGVPQSPTVSVAYIWLGWVIPPNIVYAFCMMYARLLAPNATAGLQRLLLSCHKIRTADQAVFLHIYNIINTKSLQRLKFIHQIGFTAWNPKVLLLPWEILF